MASSQGRNELKFADWMATLPESIHSIPLTNLAIPAEGARSRGQRFPDRVDSEGQAEWPRSGAWSKCVSATLGCGSGKKTIPDSAFAAQNRWERKPA
ncbi:PI-PLC X domain-containing protein 3 [Fukomys damarensis]|uniref:PI-PLC X domain-containing protein 3 n=1 Tax=Fukomys damarensis TaxID=885580 RepID=A0A091DF94_FUKDA|nr:PI-PLC X domain-containing protein 3 [Fukomys damarensis]